ncbi:MAG: hypothetical protein WC076_02175 [Terrimicrobiaceae bacterium]
MAEPLPQPGARGGIAKPAVEPGGLLLHPARPQALDQQPLSVRL